MNIILLRHGEAGNNIDRVFSDKEIYWSTLTDNGIKTVIESIGSLPNKIDKAYVSPLPRTIQTAHYVYEKYPNIEFVIENRIREINHGKYSGKQNNEELDDVRLKQMNGDYFVRLGEYGENRYDIEKRLSDFLIHIYNTNPKDSTILIISHGSVTSYIKRLLNINSPHIKTGKLEQFDNVNFSYLLDYTKELNNML